MAAGDSLPTQGSEGGEGKERRGVEERDVWEGKGGGEHEKKSKKVGFWRLFIYICCYFIIVVVDNFCLYSEKKVFTVSYIKNRSAYFCPHLPVRLN